MVDYPTRETVAGELLAMADTMDVVAEKLYSLGLADASDVVCGRAVSCSIELHGAASMARDWADGLRGE